MTKTQWRRFQRKRKAERETAESRTIGPQQNTTIGREVKPIKEKSPSPNIEEETGKVAKETPLTEDILIDDFDYDSDPSLDIVCNMILVLPVEYNCKTEVEEPLTYRLE